MQQPNKQQNKQSNKPKANKVINVYQEKYANNEYCTGLGDYIRGSLCMLQYATIQNIQFDMHYASHPISAFLRKINPILKEKPTEIELKEDTNEMLIIHPFRVYNYKINNFPNNTLQKIQKDFNKTIHNNPSGFQYDLTTFTMYSIAYPSYPVNENHKIHIRNSLYPSIELQTKINACMISYNIQPKKYNIIHVRTGDKYLINNSNDTSMSIAIECKRAFLQNISKDVLSCTIPCILISDNVNLKKQLSQVFPKFIINNYSITHMGENALTNKENAIENTLIDFFLLANSSSVYAFSALSHGTGFSEQCCELYNVDYFSFNLPI